VVAGSRRWRPITVLETLQITPPADPKLAPPGHYKLILYGDGVSSSPSTTPTRQSGPVIVNGRPTANHPWKRHPLLTGCQHVVADAQP